jgi:3'-phosphoadenosine 5'-phosphosulfate sulfotransferase (PAPS reductase)/FAD synthetase
MNSLIPRDADQLLASALAVIDEAFKTKAAKMFPLFSGGHDSLCACFVASHHPRFEGEVYHINTGIGSKKTREFVEEVCEEYGWNLRVYKSPATYEIFVRKRGFPGPGAHHWCYARIKERCIHQIMKGREPKLLITGCRQEESKRRMGSVEPIKIGEVSPTTGKVANRKRIWTAPCFDWDHHEQRAFMNAFGLPRNPVKESALGMSGECFCGAFARPGELEMIRQIVPDVAIEIERLQKIARECGTPCNWGVRPDWEKGFVKSLTGPLCSSCDRRAMAAGIIVTEPCEITE